MTEKRNAVEFLRRRYASAIRSGDDRTALRLRLQLDRVLNGRLAQAPARVASEPKRPDDRRRNGSDLLASIWLTAGSNSGGAEGGIVAAVGEDVPAQLA